ncbi:MAG TPA: ATP-binding protein [Pyrinomonadaceae bacterium]|jgi:signal transduction histidine kinase
MSLLEIIQLIGYSTGAALPLWLSLLLARQRRTLAPQERVLQALAISIGLWHASNLLLVLRVLLGLDAARWVWLLRLADTGAVVSITLSYSFLLHVHLHLWANARERPLTRFERVRVYLSYIPALFLFVAVPRLWTGAYAPMLEQLSFFVLPFGLWATYVLCLIAATDILIARASRSQSERRLMMTLAGSFLLISVLLLAVYAVGIGRDSVLKDYLQTLSNLGSLLPTALIAYHVYRYRYLELIIRESLVAASFAVVILVVYLYGIRTIETWVTGRYGLRAGAVEALLILAFALSAAPLRAWLERRFQQLFAREAALYREVVTRIGTQSRRYPQLSELLRFVEERTTHELGLRRVRFHVPDNNRLPSDNAEGNAPAFPATAEAVERPEVQALASKADGKTAPALVDGVAVKSVDDKVAGNGQLAFDWAERMLAAARAQGGVAEDTPELRAAGFELAYVLVRDEQVFGLMLVDAARAALTADIRAVLAVLAGQVAIAIEDARLVEENVLLERKLAQGERLAALGQMAAAVAHEVKNPLSAIKSIAQVMREDERVTGEYARDLELIVGETDRLSRSVTQLLSFARQTPPAGAPMRADELTRALVELFHADARARALKLEAHTTTQATLDGAQATAVRAALSNLILNALQATPAGGRVRVEAEQAPGELIFAVTDSGGGVAPELRQRIWEPFFTTRQRGTGLGLAIVRKRMEEAGGSARLAPQQPAQGARFELRLPLAIVAAELPDELPDETLASQDHL